jgi:LacI family transcriptional regulator
VNTDEDVDIEQKALGVLTERRVDGLVIAPTDVSDKEAMLAVVKAGIPIVFIDRTLPGVPADVVGIDNRAAAREATQRLLDLGHQRIALLTGAPGELRTKLTRAGLRGVERLAATTVGTRTAGYRDALVAAGLSPRPELVSAEGFRRDEAAAATRRLLELASPPTAVLALDSQLALGVLQGLHEMGLQCPRDLSLVGFDDADWTEVVSPPLSVMSQPIYDIGAEAGRLLLDRIGRPDRRPVHRTLPTRFIERSSAAFPPLASPTA